MTPLLPTPPQAPDWRVDWEALDATHPWIQAMKDVPQDPHHHAEGDVWTHTRMVCEAMAALPAWRALPAGERQVLFAAALLHDVAKPVCTVHDGQRIRSPGHAVRGARMARVILWKMGCPMALREQVAGLVRHHMLPFWLIEREDPEALAIRASLTTRCDHLAILARADALGRRCKDQQRLLEHIALFVATCEEAQCLHRPYAFPSDHTRVLYFHQRNRSPGVEAYDDTRTEVTLLAGLPGAGKDHWVQRHRPQTPCISLDRLRALLGVRPTDDQGPVIHAARERARALLRDGTPFVWNATNLTRTTRNKTIDLCLSYGARVHIVHVDTPYERLHRQNRRRDAPVPPQVIERLAGKWEMPDLTEAHHVTWVDQDETPS